LANKGNRLASVRFTFSPPGIIPGSDKSGSMVSGIDFASHEDCPDIAGRNRLRVARMSYSSQEAAVIETTGTIQSDVVSGVNIDECIPSFTSRGGRAALKLLVGVSPQ